MELRDLRREFPSDLDRAYMQYKKNQKVTDIMSRSVVTVTPEATMEDAAKIMGEKHIGSLVVTRKGKPIGIVTERDLLTNIIALGKAPKKITVKEVMSSPLLTIDPNARVKEAAQEMIKKKGKLIVFDVDKLVGILTASDLVKTLPDVPETTLVVDDFMTKKIITADERTTIGTIAKMMGTKRIGSVVTTRKGEPRGIFTERDLLTNFLAKGKPLNVAVGEVASSPVLTAPSGITIHQAAYLMDKKHIRRLPIAKDGKLIGIITARDLVEAYSK